MSKEELVKLIKEYQIENILWFSLGIFSYLLIKELLYPNRLSDIVNSINNRLKQTFKKSEDALMIKNLKFENTCLVKFNQQINKEKIELIAQNMMKDSQIMDMKHKLSAIEKDKLKLESDNENLKTKVDNLVEELMKRQSYNEIRSQSNESIKKNSRI